MKKVPVSIVIILALFATACTAPQIQPGEDSPTIPGAVDEEKPVDLEISQEEMYMKGSEEWTRYTDEEFGLTFEYRVDPDGYVLIEPDEQEGSEQVRTLIRKDAYEAAQERAGSEGPTSITIAIFDNREGLTAQQWAEQNTMYSNFQSDSDIMPYIVDDTEGISYTWEGLYAGTSVVVAREGKVFLLSLTTDSEFSSMREDYVTLLGSVKFGKEDSMYEPYRATLRGEYVCISPTDSDAQGQDCTPGLLSESGENYGIDLYLMSQEHRSLSYGENIVANGLVTPIERLSTNQWDNYPITAIFSVTDSLKIIVDPQQEEEEVVAIEENEEVQEEEKVSEENQLNLEEILSDALHKEYKNNARHAAAIEKLGKVGPFTYLVESYEDRIRELESLMKAYGYAPQKNPYLRQLEVKDTAPAICRKAMEGEEDALNHYKLHLDSLTDYADITAAFAKYIEESEEVNVPLLSKCINQ